MKLITLHRILVATAIAFCAFFVFTQCRQWLEDDSALTLGLAIGFALIGVALTWYLTNLKRLVRLEPADQDPSER